MNDNYQIVNVERPDDTAWNVIGDGIQRYNIQQAGEERAKPVCFLLYGPDREILGGVIGETHWDWLYINLLYVNEDLRGMGYGHRLLELAENEAQKRGVKNAYLDTFSFQAPEFYTKYGYRVFGELNDFPTGHRRCYLTKKL